MECVIMQPGFKLSLSKLSLSAPYFFRCNALCETICCDYGNGRRTDLLRDDAGVSISAICPDCSLYDDAQPPQGALCNRQSSPQAYLSL